MSAPEVHVRSWRKPTPHSRHTMRETRKLVAIMAVDIVGYSRLMGDDEAGTAQAVRRCREAAIPIVAALGGRIVQIVGDGLLLEFPSVVAAVECAVAIQKMMVECNADTPEDKRIVYRIGVHLGDVLIDGDDILGEGVNIAARLESICEPGGVSISRAVYDQISGKLAFGFRTLGLQKLKNIAKAVEVFAIDYADKTDDAPTPDDANVAQTIKYCRAPDGVRLAYAISGSGPFLVKSGNWMNHLEYDWESPVWRHVFRGLSRSHTLVRYDARGNGMSDWDVDTLSLDAWVTDLETVSTQSASSASRSGFSGSCPSDTPPAAGQRGSVHIAGRAWLRPHPFPGRAIDAGTHCGPENLADESRPDWIPGQSGPGRRHQPRSRRHDGGSAHA